MHRLVSNCNLLADLLQSPMFMLTELDRSLDVDTLAVSTLRNGFSIFVKLHLLSIDEKFQGEAMLSEFHTRTAANVLICYTICCMQQLA